MKKIRLLNKEYSYPTSWEDISIADYQRIQHQLKQYEEDEDDIKDLLNKINLISAYTYIPIHVLKTEKTSKVIEMVADLKFLTTEIPSEHIVEFEFKGEKYNVMQTLIAAQFQDYISLENLIQQDDLINVMHLIVAVISRKSDSETLDDYDVKARAEEFKALPITIANNISVFFYQCAKNYERISQLYSNPDQVVDIKVEELMNSLINSAGKGLLTRLQIGIIRRYIKYIVPKWKKYLRTIAVSS